MLKTIIKRDGRREEFDPAKVNQWAIWASDHIRARVDWSSIVSKAVKACGEEVSSVELQNELIKQCVRKKSWPYQIMAGRLYNAVIRKEMYNSDKPYKLVDQHTYLAHKGLMVALDYSREEYDYLETVIDHTRDMAMAYFQIKHIRNKYSVADRVNHIQYETPQFVFMRMAMALAEDEPKEVRMTHLVNWYNHFSFSRINAPSPNYMNLATGHNGLASCNLYSVDDTAASLAVGDHIAYTMTYMSAGIGGILNTRSIGDPVRGGVIQHQGKLPYFQAQGKAVLANTQGGRGGACTSYFSGFDPEVETFVMLQNPRTPVKKQNRDIHFAFLNNRLMAKKVARNEDIFLFNTFHAADLYEKLFSGDQEGFEVLYRRYELDPSFKKTYLNARELIVKLYQQRNEVAVLYTANIDEINRHTPFKDPIRSSNLCMEVTEPTHPYENMMDLYADHDISSITVRCLAYGLSKPYEHNVTLSGDYILQTKEHGQLRAINLQVGDTIDHSADPVGIDGGRDQVFTHEQVIEVISKKKGGEIALCSLAGLVPSNIHGDEEYASAAYYALKMIDKCIHMSEYKLPHVGYTAKRRLNAAVGMLGLAHHLAKKGLKYNTQEGLDEIHRVSERHAYHVIRASLQLGKELGNAPWIDKTRWPEGWLPIDTYKKTVDQIANPDYQYDWETLRNEIRINKGIRNSALIADMPTESSSKASGFPNSIYPIRDLSLKKTDATNPIEWCATDNDLLDSNYQPAWDLSVLDQVKFYAVVQKFTDQSISADFYRDRVKQPVITDDELIEEYLAYVKYGMKTQYYQNSYTGKSATIESIATDTTQHEEDAATLDLFSFEDGNGVGCAGGACTL